MVSRGVIISVFAAVFVLAQGEVGLAKRSHVAPVSISCVCLYKPTDQTDVILDYLTHIATLQCKQHKRYNSDREIALVGLIYDLNFYLRDFKLYVIALDKEPTFFIIHEDFVKNFESLVAFTDVQRWISVSSTQAQKLNVVAQKIKHEHAEELGF